MKQNKNLNYSYISVLSNWILGYDRYENIYSKKNLNKSTYPDVFYLLRDNELSIGFEKAYKLIRKIGIENNRIIRIVISASSDIPLNENIKNNKGLYIKQNFIPVGKIFIYDSSSNENLDDSKWKEISVEELNSMSFLLEDKNLQSFQSLKPLTFSFLPVGIACQAKCKFCFSKSSISSEKKKNMKDFPKLEHWLKVAKEKGAKRFVITGGGEPGLFGFDNLKISIALSKKYMEKSILFTNGIFLLPKKNDFTSESEVIKQRLYELKNSGLDILSLSLHHHNEIKNTEIMGTITRAHTIISIAKELDSNLIPTIRLICVIQKGGISGKSEIKEYIDYALNNNISQICFKELYIASTQESIYSDFQSNQYSKENKVNLKEVINYAKELNLKIINTLPWGSPIYLLQKEGKNIQFAAYTEPNVGWERANGIARSWNYMSDNKCYSSLEDNQSILNY